MKKHNKINDLMTNAQLSPEEPELASCPARQDEAASKDAGFGLKDQAVPRATALVLWGSPRQTKGERGHALLSVGLGHPPPHISHRQESSWGGVEARTRHATGTR